MTFSEEATVIPVVVPEAERTVLVPPGAPVQTVVRHELKFVLAEVDVGKLRSILRGNGRRIDHGAPVSKVTTLYFDDLRLSGCYDNLDGVPRRSKLRLRWYGNDSRRLYLEKKSRVGALVEKKRLFIESAVPLDSLSYAQIREELLESLPSSWARALVIRPEPSLVTTYEREYYQARQGGARATIDSRITFYPQVGALGPRFRFGTRARGLLILEVKLEPGGDDGLKDVLFPLELRRSRSSKYVLGCQACGLVPEG